MAIKENDVRIGNVVHAFKGIWIIDPTDFRMIDSDTRTLPYEPLPLTEEWLLKFGFEKSSVPVDDCEEIYDGAIEWQLNHVSIFQQEGKFYYEVYKYSDDYGLHYYCKEISFVHELQNMYYVLEKKELNEN